MKKNSWGFDAKDMDVKVRPQDNFYQYANGGWMQRTKLPSDEARWGTFLILRKRTDEQLRAIVESLAKSRVSSGSEAQQIRDFYRSGMDTAGRKALGAKPLAPYLKRIESLRKPADIEKLIPEFHKDGIGILWGAAVAADDKDVDWNIMHLYQSGLGLPERDYYLVQKPEQKRVRAAYHAYLTRLFVLSGECEAAAEKKAELVMRFETKLARASMKRHEMRDPNKIYHKMPLGKIAKGVSWPAYFRALGVSPPRTVNVLQPLFMKTAVGMLKSESLETWKAYLASHALRDAAPLLSEDFVEVNFDFYGRTLSGMKELRPLWRRALSMTDGALGEALGKLYVKKHFPAEAKQQIDELVENVFAAYEERLKSVPWMSAKTKVRALEKLHAMTRKVGYPEKWKSYRGLVVKPDDLFGNALRSARYEHRRNMQKLGKRVDRSEWLMTPQMVNAYYNPTTNEIAFPAAILQPPYFGPNQDASLNYGAIGGVIGHEITHGFDDEGSKFDKRGNLKSWWTKEDRARFEKRARVLEKQFDTYELHGVQVNGKLTLGENIADLGGYAIALDAYKRHLERTGSETLDSFSPLQRFFLGAALDWRQISAPEHAKTMILTDPHAPNIFRINGPVSNLQEFYEAFGVKSGDKLYRKPKDRAEIW